MVRVPVYEGPALQPSPMVQFEAPAVQPMQDIAGKQIEQLGQGISQFAQGVQSIGTAMMREAQRDQDDLDRADAIRALTDYKGRVRQRLNNDENGYFRTQGEQAYGANKVAVQEELAKYKQDAARSLSSAAARQIFSQRADADDIQIYTAINAHAGEQRNNYIKSQEKALIDSDIEDLQKLHGNPQFQERMDALRANIAGSRAMRGMSPDVVKQAQKDAVATVYSGAIDDIAAQDPVKALQALNQFAATGAFPPKYVTDKRAQLQREADEVIGDVRGFTAWDASKGNASTARIDLDRQRQEGKITPSQYRRALSAVGLQEASQKDQRAQFEQDTYDEAVRRLADPQFGLEDLSAAEKDKLVQANRWDDVVAFVNQGHQRFDNPAEVRRAEDFILQVQSGQEKPISEIEFRRRFFTSMSDATYNDFAGIYGRTVNAMQGGKGKGSRGGKTDEQEAEEEQLSVDLQQLLKDQNIAEFAQIEKGITAKLDATGANDTTAANRSKAGLKLLRFRRYFDPLFEQYREKGKDGKPMGYGAALQEAFKDVMGMGKGSDGKYDWERVPGTVPADTTKYSTASGDMEVRSFSEDEFRQAEESWAKQNPQLVAAGMAATPGMLVPLMTQARNKIRTATMIQRDSVGGMMTWQSLAAQVATIRPGMTEQQIKDDILGKADDVSMGVFRDRGHAVRAHDLVLGYEAYSVPGTAGGSFSAYRPMYADSDVAASDAAQNAIGISLASANRYLRYLSGKPYSLTSDEPAESALMPLPDAQATMERMLQSFGASTTVDMPPPYTDRQVNISIATLSQPERDALRGEALQALASLRSSSEGRNGFRPGMRYNQVERQIVAFESVVGQLSMRYSDQWQAFDPSESMKAQDAKLADVGQPATAPSLALDEQMQTRDLLDRRGPGSTAMMPLRAVQERKLLPSDRVLLDQVRATDRIEQAVADLQLDIPGLEVKASRADRSKQKSDAVAALLDGDNKLAQQFVNGNQRSVAVANWLYENVISNLPRIDRSLRQAKEAPMEQPVMPGQEAQVAPPVRMRDQLPWLKVEMRAIQEQQPGSPKLLPSERRVYDKLVKAFEQRVELETLLSPDLSPQGEQALQTLRDMQAKVLEGELREPQQFLGAYETEHNLAVAMQALTYKAMQNLQKVKAALAPETWNNLLLNTKKQ